ncbi:MAG TPA: MlaD family protein [Thermoanaerobaculia bacterium]|nr:MlaD family protein [Thermoanaerobaculia bacterium]
MSQAVKVGIFALVSLVVLALMVLRIEDVPILGGPRLSVVAEFESVAGLDDKAAVRIAGVRVGRVAGITLVDRRARVGLAIEQPVELTEGTRAVISNMGLLGEKYVELEPGPVGGPALPEGAVIPGFAPPSFDDALAKFSELGDTLGDSLGGLGGDGDLERLIANLAAVSAEIRSLVEANRGEIEATLANVERFSGTLAHELPRLTGQVEAVLLRMDRTLAQLEGVLGDSRPDVQETAANLRRLTEDAHTSVDNLNEVTGRLARGEGTLGKLLTSDEAHDELVSALGSVEAGVETLTSALGGIQKLQLELGLETYWLEAHEESQSAFTLDVDPQSGKLYRVAVIDSPFGKEETKTRRTTVTGPDGASETAVTETVERSDDLRLSALFGFPTVGAARLWAGVIESSGGVQVEYPLLDQRLWLSLEAFELDREGDLGPRFRLSGRYRLGEMLYLRAGYDDFLEGDRDSLFLGGGLRWRDDQLKYLLGSLPRF